MNIRLWMGTAVSAAILAVGPSAVCAQDNAGTGGKTKIHSTKVRTIQDETQTILGNVTDQAYTVYDQSLLLESGLSDPNLDRSFFANRMNEIRAGVNSMGQEIARLEALSSYETMPERSVVEAAKPQLAQIAATAEQSIHVLNATPARVILPEYHEIATKLSNQSEALWKLLHDSATLSGLAKREQNLKTDLGRVEAGQ